MKKEFNVDQLKSALVDQPFKSVFKATVAFYLAQLVIIGVFGLGLFGTGSIMYLSIKIKAFIYRLSDVFGKTIYLARKEEELYMELLNEAEGPLAEMWDGVERGSWQAHYGFTTVWTFREPWYKAVWAKIKHAFDFKGFPRS